MAKPTFTPPTVAGTAAGWDADVQDGFDQVKEVFVDAPMPIPKHVGDESDLEATWPAASYQECIAFVNHTVDGLILVFSDGTVWKRSDGSAL